MDPSISRNVHDPSMVYPPWYLQPPCLLPLKKSHVFSAGNGTMPLSFEVDNFREKSFEVPLQLTAQRVREAVAMTRGLGQKRSDQRPRGENAWGGGGLGLTVKNGLRMVELFFSDRCGGKERKEATHHFGDTVIR